MKNLTILILTFFFIKVQAQQPTFNWVNAFETNQSGSIKDLSIDPSGNLIITGGYRGTMDFDPGAGIATMTNNDGTSFVAKYDASGNYIWAVDFEYTTSTGYDESYAVTSTNTGEIYVVGTYDNEMDLDPGPLQDLVSAPFSGDAIFVVKLDTGGNYLWGHSFESPSVNGVDEVIADNNGDVYFVGAIADSIDFNSGIGNNYVYGLNGGTDAYIVKLDGNGNFVWGHSQGGLFSDRGRLVEVDGNNNVYFVGHFRDSADADPGPGFTWLTTTNFQNTFVQKYTPNGTLIWAGSLRSNNIVDNNDLAIDAQDNIILGGKYLETTDVDFGPGVTNITTIAVNQDAYIIKYDSTGTLQWVTTLNDSLNYGEISENVTTDSQNNVYIKGLFCNTIDFDPGLGVVNVTADSTFADGFIQKLDANGNFEWVGVIQMDLQSVEASAMKVGMNDQIYLVGEVNDTADMDPNAGLANLFPQGFTPMPYILCLNGSFTTESNEVISNIQAINIYPIPSAGEVTVDFGKIYQSINVRVTDLSGRTIINEQFYNSNHEIMQLPFSSGIYFLHIESNEFKKIIKIVKK